MERISKAEGLQRRESGQPERVQDRPSRAPRVDIFENDQEVLLIADLPGVDKGNLNIHLDEDQLTLFGMCGEEVKGSVLSAEFRAVDYQRTFLVPAGIEGTKISADLRHGVLYLHLPKSEAVKPRQITVKAG